MEFEDAFKKLAHHSPLGDTVDGSAGPSLTFALWQSGRSNVAPEIKPMYDEIIDCLDAVNRHVNGEVPSATIFNAESADSLDRKLVYVVNSLIRDCWEYYVLWQREERFDRRFRTELANVAWAIGLAWDGILASDIDSLREYVEHNGGFRGLVP